MVPQAVQGVRQTLVPGISGHIRHAAVQVHGTHGMAGDPGKVPDRELVLVIDGRPGPVVPVGTVPVAALVQQPAGEVQVLLFSCHFEQLDQGQLDFLVPRHPVASLRAENGHHMVGETDGHVQQFPLAGRLVIGDGRLRHVTGTVHLVLVHVLPTVLQPGEGVIGIQVSIGLLGGRELVDPLVTLGLQHRIRLDLQGISHALERLIHVGIVVENTRMLPFPFRRVLEIPDPAGLVLDLVDAHGQGDILVDPEPGTPETIVDLHIGKTHRRHQFPVVQFLRPGTGEQGQGGEPQEE